MDSWLLDHLIRAGHVTETGLARRARIRTCECGERVLAGLDAEVCAFEVHADPMPLTALGEALALIDGRRTFAVHHEGGRYVLDWRDGHSITEAPAGTQPREDVLRGHRCRTSPPTGSQVAPSSFVKSTPPLPADAPAPF